MRRRSLLVVLVLAVLGAAALVVRAVAFEPAIEQPIAFNHKLHHQTNGIECTECHLYAKDDISATLPTAQVCGTCHDEDTLPDEPQARQQLMKVVEYIKKGKDIPWQRLYRVPEHVYFSHKRHASLAAIACEVCHGDMGSQTEPPPRALKALTMNDCMECHRQREVSNDCILCHK